ncbi:MAG: TOBE domain-containing protein [Deltaproteobacteria bacterium]|nr:TOBE domain-containing protein [Deltaproteobacteria bacterium]
MKSAMPGPGLEVSGALCLRKSDAPFLQDDRIDLLEKIDELGSITRAARAAGMSYKTAWHTVDALNNLAEEPLVRRWAGGRGGGGAVLTDEGREAVRTYRIIRREHQTFLERLGKEIEDVDRYYALLRRVAVRVSARNVFRGTVKSVRKGVVSTEVTLSLPGGESLCAIITNESAGSLGLAEGKEAYALFKASSVVLGRDLHTVRTSARNLLCGTVERLTEGPVNAEVTVALPGGSVLTAIITEESAKRLDLAKGEHACALVKASSVIIGVPG